MPERTPATRQRAMAELLPPRLIPRKCGGWLALSNDADPVKIGVTAASEADADVEFQKARKRWRVLLHERGTAMDRYGGLHLTAQATRLVVRLLSQHAESIRANLDNAPLSEDERADLANELGYVEAIIKSASVPQPSCASDKPEDAERGLSRDG